MTNKVSKTGERYISYYSGYYNVQKRLGGKAIVFARFKTLEDAIPYRDKCIESNWDLSLKKTKSQRTLTGMKYIQRVGVGYQVSKHIDGTKKHYGWFMTKEDAMKHRDYCVQNNWSRDCIHRINNKHNLPPYICYNKGKYVVQKLFPDGKTFNMRFKNLEDAIQERDLLLRVDWDEERLIELDECEGTL